MISIVFRARRILLPAGMSDSPLQFLDRRGKDALPSPSKRRCD